MKELFHLSPAGARRISGMPDGTSAILWSRLAEGVLYTDSLGNLVAIVNPTSAIHSEWARWRDLVSPRGLCGNKAMELVYVEESQRVNFRAIYFVGKVGFDTVGRAGAKQHSDFMRTSRPGEERRANGTACLPGSGFVCFASERHNRVFSVGHGGRITPVVGNGRPGFCLSNKPEECMLKLPSGLASDHGNSRFYVSDSGNSVIREFISEGGALRNGRLCGMPETAGDRDGACHEARLFHPSDICSCQGCLYVADGSRLCRISKDNLSCETAYRSQGRIESVSAGEGDEAYFVEVRDA